MFTKNQKKKKAAKNGLDLNKVSNAISNSNENDRDVTKAFDAKIPSESIKGRAINEAKKRANDVIKAYITQVPDYTIKETDYWSDIEKTIDKSAFSASDKLAWSLLKKSETRRLNIKLIGYFINKYDKKIIAVKNILQKKLKGLDPKFQDLEMLSTYISGNHGPNSEMYKKIPESIRKELIYSSELRNQIKKYNENIKSSNARYAKYIAYNANNIYELDSTSKTPQFKKLNENGILISGNKEEDLKLLAQFLYINGQSDAAELAIKQAYNHSDKSIGKFADYMKMQLQTGWVFEKNYEKVAQQSKKFFRYVSDKGEEKSKSLYQLAGKFNFVDKNGVLKPEYSKFDNNINKRFNIAFNIKLSEDLLSTDAKAQIDKDSLLLLKTEYKNFTNAALGINGDKINEEAEKQALEEEKNRIFRRQQNRIQNLPKIKAANQEMIEYAKKHNLDNIYKIDIANVFDNPDSIYKKIEDLKQKQKKDYFRHELTSSRVPSDKINKIMEYVDDGYINEKNILDLSNQYKENPDLVDDKAFNARIETEIFKTVNENETKAFLEEQRNTMQQRYSSLKNYLITGKGLDQIKDENTKKMAQMYKKGIDRARALNGRLEERFINGQMVIWDKKLNKAADRPLIRDYLAYSEKKIDGFGFEGESLANLAGNKKDNLLDLARIRYSGGNNYQTGQAGADLYKDKNYQQEQQKYMFYAKTMFDTVKTAKQNGEFAELAIRKRIDELNRSTAGLGDNVYKSYKEMYGEPDNDYTQFLNKNKLEDPTSKRGVATIPELNKQTMF